MAIKPTRPAMPKRKGGTELERNGLVQQTSTLSPLIKPKFKASGKGKRRFF